MRGACLVSEVRESALEPRTVATTMLYLEIVDMVWSTRAMRNEAHGRVIHATWSRVLCSAARADDEYLMKQSERLR